MNESDASQEPRTVDIDGVTLHLARPAPAGPPWIGQDEVMLQLQAAWARIGDGDLPLNPRLLGKPGVGKTTLACAAARRLDLETFILQATMDTRPEDLIVAPVLAPDGSIRYVASALTTAMLTGGALVLDEGNRMSERAWASLAPLLDHRRSVESVVAGVRIEAHDEFRFVTTMNEDASTYEVPEYIHSRLMPQIYVDFPDADEERRILEEGVPYAEDEVITYVVEFLEAAHRADLRFTSRDGINMVRYAMKLLRRGEAADPRRAVELARGQVSGAEEAEELGGSDSE